MFSSACRNLVIWIYSIFFPSDFLFLLLVAVEYGLFGVVFILDRCIFDSIVSFGFVFMVFLRFVIFWHLCEPFTLSMPDLWFLFVKCYSVDSFVLIHAFFHVNLYPPFVFLRLVYLFL